MLEIYIPPTTLFNEETMGIIEFKGQKIRLEHSLISISKWEEKWHKAFLDDNNKSSDELLDYIKCMTLTPNVSDVAYLCLTSENHKAISDYINDPRTATWFSDDNKKQRNSQVVTNELIYYWIIAFNIPIEAEKWHINKLLTLIRVCEAMNEPKKKLKGKELIEHNKRLNAERRAKYKQRKK